MSTMEADVLLVGSVPLESGEEVMRTCAGSLGDVVAAIPDGETGDRIIWVIFQAYRVFDEHPQLETVQRPSPAPGKPDWAPSGLEDLWSFRIRDGVDEVRFDDLRYASVAEQSYRTFVSLREKGEIPEGVRFQVCLPLVESGCAWFFQDPEQLQRIVGPYEEALIGEVEKIANAIPHDDLAIQWDTCWEVLDVEGIFPWALPGDSLERFQATASRVAPHVPEGALMGYHLCYADLGHRHMKEPENLGLCVRMANAAVAHSGRRVDWFHVPVPRDRNDDSYFEPLADLEVGDAKVFIGLVHHTDGVEGTRERVETAKRHIADFGVATECGFGRRDPATLPELFEIHKQAADALHGAGAGG